MNPPTTTLLDLRGQIQSALQSALADYHVPVQQAFPRAPVNQPLVSYAEFDNHSTSCPVVDEISFQIDIWAFDRQTVRAISDAVNRAMLQIGFRRLFASPDSVQDQHLERKTFRFGRKIDKRFMRLID